MQYCIWCWLRRGLTEVKGGSEPAVNTGEWRDVAGMGHSGFVLPAWLLML